MFRLLRYTQQIQFFILVSESVPDGVVVLVDVLVLVLVFVPYLAAEPVVGNGIGI
jgi:hypothetical protein